MLINVNGRKPAHRLHVRLEGRGMPISQPLHEFVQRRLRSALGRFAGRIAEAEVCLHNAPAGTAELSCRIGLRLGRNCRIVVSGRHTDLYAAVAQAARRAAVAVERELTRRQVRRKRAFQPAMAEGG